MDLIKLYRAKKNRPNWEKNEAKKAVNLTLNVGIFFSNVYTKILYSRWKISICYSAKKEKQKWRLN